MKNISATDARKQLFELIELVGKPGTMVTIKHRDLPNVVLMSHEEFEGWEETLEILSDPELVKDIRSGLKEISAKKTTDLRSVKKKLKL